MDREWGYDDMMRCDDFRNEMDKLQESANPRHVPSTLSIERLVLLPTSVEQYRT